MNTNTKDMSPAMAEEHLKELLGLLPDDELIVDQEDDTDLYGIIDRFTGDIIGAGVDENAAVLDAIATCEGWTP